MKKMLQTSISETTMNHIEELIQTLPRKTINGKLQNIYSSHIIELYSTIIHNYFDLDMLSIEYEMLDIVDGRRSVV